MAAAQLSYQNHFGYYGLRVNPTFDEALKSVRKPLRVPVPDRRATWYALSPYRALILDAEQRLNDVEGALLDYRNSGAELPELAARVRPTPAGDDEAWMNIEEDNRRMHDQHQHEEAARFLREQNQQETEAARTEALGKMHGAFKSHPVIEAAGEELTQAGITHEKLGEDPMVVRAQVNNYKAPLAQMASTGQPQAPEFPSFEVLNMGQPTNLMLAKMPRETAMSYENMRNMLPERTWDRTQRS